MKINLKSLTNSLVLAGSVDGRRVLLEFLRIAENEPEKPEPLFLDFAGIEVATASFLRESVLEFRGIIRARRSNFYPVVANASDEVQEEMEELLRSRGDVLMTCLLNETNQVANPAVIGNLHPKQSLTYNLVHKHGETDAVELTRDYQGKESTKQTAWNNRLASLAALGLIVEITQGRNKRYKPLFEGV